MCDKYPGLIPNLWSSSDDQEKTAFVTLESGPSTAFGTSPFHILKLVWAALLADYIESKALSFGVLVSREHLQLEHWAANIDLDQPFPLAVRLQRLGSQSIGDISFNTVLHWEDDTDVWPKCPFNEISVLSNVGIIIVATERDYVIQLALYYRCAVLGEAEAQNMITALGALLDASPSTSQPARISCTIHDHHLFQLQNWNSRSSDILVEDCIHHLFQRQSAKEPWKPAVCAWDGEFTYQEVEIFSNTIAARLQKHNSIPDSIVPIFLPKSKWAVVAIMGVLKVGAAFVLLDTSYPAVRLQNICEDVQPKVIICFSDAPSIEYPLVKMIIGNEVYGQPTVSPPMVSTSPCNAAYISFTSGSTGRPKGVVIEHRSFCTNALATSQAHRLDGRSRVLQYASFAFDVSILECLAPLLLGGCVCIPSEHQRMNWLAESCNDLQVNWAELTPSVARMLQPAEVPSIRTLVLGGEPILRTDISQWKHVDLICAYGPAECTVVSTVQSHVRDPGNIGRCYGGSAWIVDKENHERLLPIGPIGELVIGGPIVGRGYLNRPAQTEAAFVSIPTWGSLFGLGPDARLYKSGDLARYATDGSIIYCGRKDTQVKIHGQRVELEEIESHARKFLADYGVVVELAGVVNERPFLVLFLAPRCSADYQDLSASLFHEPDAGFHQLIDHLKDALHNALPVHMIPTTYIPISRIPLTPTGKVDRKLLRELVDELTLSQLRKYRSGLMAEATTSPTTPTETILRQLVATELGMPESKVAATDSFLELGGDSLSAISLVANARNIGLQFSMSSVFQADSIRTLAAEIRKIDGELNLQYQPLSLVNGDRHALVQQAAVQCHLRPSDIEDIYPCTPLQEAMIGFSLQQPGSFQADFSFSLPATVDLGRFWDAWDTVISARPILRTRIVQLFLPHALQVVVRSAQTRQEQPYEDTFMTLGTPLVQLSMAGPVTFTLTMHHALFDQWSYDLILEDVEAVYRGLTLVPQSYAPFIRYTIDSSNESARVFWKKEHQGLYMRHFPSTPRSLQPETTTINRTHRPLHIVHWPHGHFTRTTVIRLAYAILIGQTTRSSDVVFGVTVNGRNASVPGLDKLAAPTIATMPLRVILRNEDSVHETLLRMQQHAAELIPYEHTGLRWIKTCSYEAASACQFQSLLVVQQHARKESSPGLFHHPMGDFPAQSNFSTHPLTVICDLAPEGVSVAIFYDSGLVSSEFAETVIKQLEYLISRLAIDLAEPMSKLLLSPPVGLLPMYETVNSPGDLVSSSSSSSITSAALASWTSKPLKQTISTLLNSAHLSTPNKTLVSRALKELGPVQRDTANQLRAIVASVLRLTAEEISDSDDFFALGGDSATAMQVVMQCKTEGLALTVRDIFNEKTMVCIAATLQPLQAVTSVVQFATEYKRFSLLGMTPDEERILEIQLKRQLGISHLDLVEDVYPCTAVHEGLLRTQLLEPMTHQSFTLWEVVSHCGSVSPYRLREAWAQVSRRQAALRTVLLDNFLPERPWTKMQVVFHDPVSAASVFTGVSEDYCHLSSHPLRHVAGSPPCHFSVYQTVENRVYCKLEGTQAFLDSKSISILLKDLTHAYTNTLSSEKGPLYRSVVEVLASPSNRVSSEAYWKRQIALARPCIFPHLPGANDPEKETLKVSSLALSLDNDLARFCADGGYTLNTVLQVAWGMTLQQYTGQSAICFGTLVSGRDILLAEIDQTVGSFFNVLPCCLDLSTAPHALCLPVILRENQSESANRLAHQHCSLLHILEHSPYYGHRRLFNTCFSLEESLSSAAQGPDQEGIRFVERDTHEPTEYDLLLTCVDTQSALEARLTYWSSGLSEEQATGVLWAFQNHVRIITALR
ncbi:acetyl-CoA synthetase-like protein [Aspergillus steynii IBT 23096]|uniref:Acetyl-CoA synthetase-like protein n=1 Tax=Aspergillus steynii IBT 23096 TaxID=1392250 RepID=A0A2I2GGN5_9EURO|nr:acetyl-CoA synthetase-like protein [Aspergillus steynii IBT 23096]PLB52030.1 acetyl-CoA synthetase-like protein [Aspergillus steynii IBT 23096]